MKKTSFARSFEYFKMLTKLGINELGTKDFHTRIEQARIITESLSQLRGVAMKAGQMLSLEMADYFPPQAIEILSRLQNNSVSFDFAEIEGVLREDLGPERLSQIQELSALAFAAASIGQVHRARFRNQDIAVKIQYPGVRESIDSDLKILRRIGDAFCKLTGRQMDLGPLFVELRTQLAQEVDYAQEAAHIIRFGELLKEELPASKGFHVPEVITELSTGRVLTMSWETGVPLNDWLKNPHSLERRMQMGHTFLNLFCLEFFRFGLVQTDPNYGNFLIQDKPELRITLLDFGAAREYSAEFRSRYAAILRTLETRDHQAIIEQAENFGLLDARESAETKKIFCEFMIFAVEPFFSGKTFNFKDETYVKRSIAEGQKLSRAFKFSPPPHHILFLHRKLGGIFSILKRLEVEIELLPYWNKMVH